MRRLATTLLSGALFAFAPAMVKNAAAQAPAPPTAPAQRPATTPPERPATAPAAKPESPKAQPIDINRASEKDLDALPGIGPARAKAIVAGRPYKSKDELTSRKIIPQNVYDGIKDRIVARQM